MFLNYYSEIWKKQELKGPKDCNTGLVRLKQLTKMNHKAIYFHSNKHYNEILSVKLF